MAIKARLTPDDLWKLGEGDTRRELVDGEVLEMAPAGGVHGDVTSRICRRMAEHVAGDGSGKVLVGDVGFVLELARDRDRVRAPDIAFVSTARLPEGRLPEGFIRGAPDVAVEVLSPSDNSVDVQQKVRDYLDAGARLVWVIAPAARTATVYRADGSARLLREGEGLDGEDVLPHLLIPLSSLFD
jgi:Uma2 family endonuclease